jgi:hypothetical protein
LFQSVHLIGQTSNAPKNTIISNFSIVAEKRHYDNKDVDVCSRKAQIR